MFVEIEKENTEERVLELYACAGDMFERFERERLSSTLKKDVACPSAVV